MRSKERYKKDHLANSGQEIQTARPHSKPTGRFKRFPATLLIVFLFLQFLTGCARLIYYGVDWDLVYYEGDYHGKVIDAKTLQPIEGAVVLGVWSKAYGTVAGSVHEYYDARETLTDKNGDFTINGMGSRVLTHLEKMKIVIFKAGYEDVGLTPWDTLKTAEYYENRVRWEGDKAIISLEELSLEERRKRINPSPTGVPMETHKMLLEEIRKDRFWIK